MTRSIYIFTSWCALLAAAAVGASAQSFPISDGHDHHDEGSRPAVCGMAVFDDGGEREALAKTARNHPETYRKIVETRKVDRRMAPLSADDGVILPFKMRNRVTGEYDQINALLVYNGRRARIWVDVNDTTRVKKTTIRAFAKGLDSVTGSTSRDPNKGILENDEDVYGLPPLNRFDIPASMFEDFLLTDIKDNYKGGNVLGFFSPWDQTDNEGSNQMNILYIDSREGLGNQSTAAINGVLSTLAHEYQHLIHYRWNRQSETMYNEGCSETASTLCGYHDRQNTGFLSNTNIALFRWSDGTVYQDLENDYQRAMTFVRYLYEQYGESFLTKLLVTQSLGMNRLGDALAAIGREPDWKGALKGFAAANYVLRNYPDTRYTYRLQLSNSIPKPVSTYSEEFPNTTSATVQQYASAYYIYNFATPGGMKISFQGSPSSYTAMAILYNGTQIVDVRELDNKTENTIGATVGYSRIVLAIVSLSAGQQSVSWTVEKIASGVESPAVAAAGLAVTDITPNPASARAEIRFRTGHAGPVTLQLFDIQGRLVRTLIDGEAREAGDGSYLIDTEGLPTNVYMLRLSDGRQTQSRALVVTR